MEKKQIAESKIAATVLLQCALLGLTAVMVFLKQAVLPQSVNQAGMDANLVTLAGGFFLFGWFQILFFPMYFSDPNRIGKPFLLCSAVLFLLVILEIVLCFTVPFVTSRLDTPDNSYLTAKFVVLLAAVAWYAGMTVWSMRLSAARFEKVDF